MASTKPRPLIAVSYEEYAREYLRSLPLEHFMEATSQAKQREITLESLALVKARRPDVHVFNELLVQYPRPGQRRPGQVVPDNMVVISDQPLEASTSYNLPLEPVGPFWVLEYVSKNNKRKDYEDNFDRYEQELKVPYFLLFYPDTQDLTLYHHTGEKYVSVKPNEQGRYPIPELELEFALLDGWVRYWHREELLSLPADLQRDLEQARRQAEEATRRANDEARRAEEEARRADEATSRTEEALRRVDAVVRGAEEATRRAEEATAHAEKATRLAEEATTRAEDLQRRLEAAERALAGLRGT